MTYLRACGFDEVGDCVVDFAFMVTFNWIVGFLCVAFRVFCLMIWRFAGLLGFVLRLWVCVCRLLLYLDLIVGFVALLCGCGFVSGLAL